MEQGRIHREPPHFLKAVLTWADNDKLLKKRGTSRYSTRSVFFNVLAGVS
jgi:hypothetical protein